MNLSFISYLNSKKILLPLMLLSCISNAMEQSNKSPFASLPKEFKQQICLTIAPETTSHKEAIIALCKISETEKELLEIIKSPYFTRLFAQALHKKFGISKLTARHALHTEAAQKHIMSRMATVAQYAFLNHNSFIVEAGGISKIKNGPLSIFALEQAHKNLQQRRKKDHGVWSNTEETGTKELPTIEPLVFTHYQDKDQGMRTALKLFYYSTHSDQVVQNFVLNEKRIENESLFSLLFRNTLSLFHTPFEDTPLFEEYSNKIKPFIK